MNRLPHRSLLAPRDRAVRRTLFPTAWPMQPARGRRSLDALPTPRPVAKGDATQEKLASAERVLRGFCSLVGRTAGFVPACWGKEGDDLQNSVALPYTLGVARRAALSSSVARDEVPKECTRAVAIAVVLGIVSVAGSARPHGGGLNAEGCHNNRKTGEYHCHRTPRTTQPAQTPSSGARREGRRPRSCGAKLYCTQMSSCEEATFYFSQCGLSRSGRRQRRCSLREPLPLGACLTIGR